MRVFQRIPLFTVDLQHIQQCTEAVKAVADNIRILL